MINDLEALIYGQDSEAGAGKVAVQVCPLLPSTPSRLSLRHLLTLGVSSVVFPPFPFPPRAMQQTQRTSQPKKRTAPPAAESSTLDAHKDKKSKKTPK